MFVASVDDAVGPKDALSRGWPVHRVGEEASNAVVYAKRRLCGPARGVVRQREGTRRTPSKRAAAPRSHRRRLGVDGLRSESSVQSRSLPSDAVAMISTITI
uniref:Uncharacterized protein n=1 Tax=Corethron hystrix TaxID=216773 RepID=A0A7S1FLA8_9STRA